MIGYWIQRHDYTSIEVENATLGETLVAYSKFDWKNELSLYVEGESGRDCPPGIGVHNAIPLTEKNGMLLHICPFSELKASVSFHHQNKSKYLRVFSTYRSVVKNMADVDLAIVPDLISAFYSGDWDRIKGE